MGLTATTPEGQRREARTTALVLALVLVLGCGFTALVAWAVLLPALRGLLS